LIDVYGWDGWFLLLLWGDLKIQRFKDSRFKIQDSRFKIQDSRFKDSRFKDSRFKDSKIQDSKIQDSRFKDSRFKIQDSRFIRQLTDKDSKTYKI
jgi:hypothetical protein